MKLFQLCAAAMCATMMGGCVSARASHPRQIAVEEQEPAPGTPITESLNLAPALVSPATDQIDSSGVTNAEAKVPSFGNSTMLPNLAQRQNVFLRAVVNVQTTMTQTMYDHRRSVNVAAGTYYFDCVGMTDYMLRATPRARDSLRAAAGIRPGFIPSPWSHFRAFSSGNLPNWIRKNRVSDLRAGDLLVWVYPNVMDSTGKRPKGHAVIIASDPVPLPNGGFAFRVYDSTGTPHGRFDSRLTDRRAIPLPDRAWGSGLGWGVIGLFPDSTGQNIAQVQWSIGNRIRNIISVAGTPLR